MVFTNDIPDFIQCLHRLSTRIVVPGKAKVIRRIHTREFMTLIISYKRKGKCRRVENRGRDSEDQSGAAGVQLSLRPEGASPCHTQAHLVSRFDIRFHLLKAESISLTAFIDLATVMASACSIAFDEEGRGLPKGILAQATQFAGSRGRQQRVHLI